MNLQYGELLPFSLAIMQLKPIHSSSLHLKRSAGLPVFPCKCFASQPRGVFGYKVMLLTLMTL